MVNYQHSKGFTLLELLVAMAIFAALASLAYFSLNNFIKQSQVLDVSNTKLSNIQKAIVLLERDLSQIAPRPIRDESGVLQPAFRVIAEHKTFEFTRGGIPTLSNEQSTLSRVRYEYKDDQLLRVTWGSIDRLTDKNAVSIALLGEIGDFSIEFLDKDGWEEDWPPALDIPEDQGNDESLIYLPRAIRVEMEIEGFGNMVKLIPGTSL